MQYKDYKYLLVTFAGILLFFGVFYFVVFKTYSGRIADKEVQLSELNYTLDNYYQPTTAMSSIVKMDAYYRQLIELKKKKQANVAQLKKTLALTLRDEFVLKKEEKYKGSYFKKILDRKRTELLQLAARRNIEIPEDLGFGEEIPPDDQADDSLKMLFIKNHLVRMALEAGVQQITHIDHFDRTRTGPSADSIFINEYPVQITVLATLESAMKVIYGLRSKNQFLVLRDLKIDSSNQGPEDDERILGVVLNVAGLTFDDIDEQALKPTVKPVFKKTAVPLGF